MTDNLNPLLLDAKREYSLRLSEIMSPFVMSTLNTMYTKAIHDAGHMKSLIEFQKQLQTIPQWNSCVIKELSSNITSKYPFFEDLVAAVMVTYVKVLSSIRISSSRPNIKLKLPSVDAFVHQVYISTAKNFYENARVMQTTDRQTKHQLIADGIESAVRVLLPLGDVLQAYLTNAVDESRSTVNPVHSPVKSEIVDDDVQKEEEEQDDDDDDDDFSDPDETTTTTVIPLPQQTPSPHDAPVQPPSHPELPAQSFLGHDPPAQLSPHHDPPTQPPPSHTHPITHPTPSHTHAPQPPPPQTVLFSGAGVGDVSDTVWK